MMSVAVFSVIYPRIERYIPEFLSSLSRQTNKNFTLFLINNRLANIETFLKKADLNVRVMERVGLPTELRKTGIEWLVSQGAEIIIFADADDYFEENRIEVSIDILNKCDLVFNELILTGEGIINHTPMLNTHFSDGEKVSVECIRTANCMGLTNTGLHAKIIPRCFESIPNNIIAFDWALFAMCIHVGARTVFTNETKTYYRQHGNNMASPHSLSEKQIMRGVEVKKDHYQLFSRFYKEYIPLANLFEDLFFQLRNNKILRQNYCQAVKQHASTVPLWWEPIKSLEELGL